MNNLELAVCVIAIAVAQLLTVLLTIGRERDIKELRGQVNELRGLLNEQRLRIVALRAWLAGRNAPQPSRISSEREPMREPMANTTEAPEPTIMPKDSPDAIPSTTADGLTRATNAFKWFKEDADEPREIVEARQIVAGLKGGALQEPAVTPGDLPQTVQPRTAEDEDAQTKKANWSRDILAGLRGGLKDAPPEPATTTKDSSDTIPSAAEVEFKRVTKAINWLKEEADNAREIGQKS
jgi:hypothetical protein